MKKLKPIQIQNDFFDNVNDGTTSTTKVEVRVIERDPPPPNNIVIVEGGCIDTPLSELMKESDDAGCVLCGGVLSDNPAEQRTVIINGGNWIACKKCKLI